MPAYDPRIHHRRSIRLNGYDYSQPGYYYITLVTQGRQCFFGEVLDGQMRLNYAGQMVYKWWCELPNKFPTITSDESIVMPNHFHGIIVIHDAIGGTQTGEGAHVGSRDTHVGVSLLHSTENYGKETITNILYEMIIAWIVSANISSLIRSIGNRTMDILDWFSSLPSCLLFPIIPVQYNY